MARYQSPAAKRYLRRFFPTMIAYVVILFACSHAIDAWQPQGALLFTLAVLPAIPILVCIAVIGLYIAEEPDEYLKASIVVSMLWATGVVLATATVLGFLQIGDVIGKVDVFWAFPIWCFTWGLTQCVRTWRDCRPGAGE